MKTPKERDDIDLLELVCQLHSRSAMQPMNKDMHNAWVEANKELESRLKAYSDHVLLERMPSKDALFTLLKKHSTDYIESEERGICVDDLDVDSFLNEAVEKFECKPPLMSKKEVYKQSLIEHPQKLIPQQGDVNTTLRIGWCDGVNWHISHLEQQGEKLSVPSEVIRKAILYGYNLDANTSLAQKDVINYNLDVFIEDYIKSHLEQQGEKEEGNN